MRASESGSEPSSVQGASAEQVSTAARVDLLYRDQLLAVHQRHDRVFAWLMGCQWLAAVIIALVLSPRNWSGKFDTAHLHVGYALFLGGLLSVPSIVLAVRRPGWVVTRWTITVSQMMWSALLIHLTGGRIETHFHIFGSLAFLAFYRDPKLISLATVVVAGDHLIRGLTWPESVYGITNPEWWRFLEHALWVVFEDIVLLMSIRQNVCEMRVLAREQVAMQDIRATMEQKVVDRTRDLEASREQYRALVERTRVVPWQWDVASERFLYVGPQGAELLGCAVEDWLKPGFWAERAHPEDRAAVHERRLSIANRAADTQFEFRMKRNDGGWVWVRSILSGRREGEATSCLQGFMLDVTEQRRIEFELQQAQKLESVGRLAAGIAHEINTPIQFVSDSVHFVRDAVNDLFVLLEKLLSVQRSVQEGRPSAEFAAQAAAAEESADLDYLIDNVPKALDRSLDGLNRVATIVRSMKEFAHPDQQDMAAIDLNRAIESTLVIARNEYKYVAEVETELGDLPPITCHAGDVNQAVLNIVVNAAHAIGDVVRGSEEKGRIRVQTRRDGEHVVITIQDTGGGIPLDVQPKIFEPFFTTKEVGKGTGQGLAIARSVIVEKHGGELTFESEAGRGTTFLIRLPIHGRTREKTREAA